MTVEMFFHPMPRNTAVFVALLGMGGAGGAWHGFWSRAGWRGWSFSRVGIRTDADGDGRREAGAGVIASNKTAKGLAYEN